MKRSHLLVSARALTLLVVALSLAGCDKSLPDPAQKSACEGFAAHLATIVQTEQGETVPKEQLDAMLTSTVEACLESPPSSEAMQCAMAALNTKAIKACDPKAPKPAQ
jgi:hypothetical protein